jgi:hypothetical protein
MEYWSYLLAVVGITGIFFVGKKTAFGWLILFVNEILWITYALISQQYGFLLMAIAYMIVYLKSYREWTS